jgi:acetolactate synthase-1/3 small subunit
MKHIITALVENQPGVLARVVGLISGRGYNIESLSVGPTHETGISRITMQVPGDDRVLEQVTKQLNRLVDVIHVTDLTTAPLLNRELVLLKVSAPPARREAINQKAQAAGALVVAEEPETLTLQITGEQAAVAAFIEEMKPYSILDLARSGIIVLARNGAA